LGNLLLGRNIFKGETPEESREKILNMPIPDFRELDTRIDDRLNDILQRVLVHDVDKRYSDANKLLYDLEHYIYHAGYGPTNETLGRFIRELFGQDLSVRAEDRGQTAVLNNPSLQSEIRATP
jgi:eukaryotic-like serine/threonine-protein kinase